MSLDRQTVIRRLEDLANAKVGGPMPMNAWGPELAELAAAALDLIRPPTTDILRIWERRGPDAEITAERIAELTNDPVGAIYAALRQAQTDGLLKSRVLADNSTEPITMWALTTAGKARWHTRFV